MVLHTGGPQAGIIVGCDVNMEMTVRATQSGELVTIDLPSVLHELGHLTRLFRTNDKMHVLRVDNSTGRYVGVTAHESGGFVARINKNRTIRSAKARTVAINRVMAMKETSEMSRLRRLRMAQSASNDGGEGGGESAATASNDGGDGVVDGSNDDVDDECVFVHERTWAERDAEGRAAAVDLDENE